MPNGELLVNEKPSSRIVSGKTKLFPVTSLSPANGMPRTLLISRENGRLLKTYGVKKVRSNMKFSFIIGAVTVFLWCKIALADSRIINDLKYLEYLNDLDRRNVELDDIHRQWPFHNIAKNLDEGEEENLDIDNEKLLKAVNLARVELANKHHQNYRDRLFERLEDGFKHLKDSPERADQLSQYRRYKPFEQDVLEEARMYPEKNEEVQFNDDDNNAYQNSDIIIDDEDEDAPIIRPSLPRPFFPRIAPVEKPVNYENVFQESPSSEEEPSEIQEEDEEIIPNIRPSFPKSYLFPRIAPVDIPVNYKIDDFGDSKSEIEDNNQNNMLHQHDDYKFKEGEEFPHSNDFNEVSVAEDPSEFGVGPSDPRFYRDAEETKITTPPRQDGQLLGTKTYYVQKPKMNSRSDLQNQQLLKETQDTDSYLDPKNVKDVEMVPFKPDAEADTAGVYIIAIVAGISAAATVGLIAVGIGWYKCRNGRQRNTVNGCISE